MIFLERSAHNSKRYIRPSIRLGNGMNGIKARGGLLEDPEYYCLVGLAMSE